MGFILVPVIGFSHGKLWPKTNHDAEPDWIPATADSTVAYNPKDRSERDGDWIDNEAVAGWSLVQHAVRTKRDEADYGIVANGAWEAQEP